MFITTITTEDGRELKTSGHSWLQDAIGWAHGYWRAQPARTVRVHDSKTGEQVWVMGPIPRRE